MNPRDRSVNFSASISSSRGTWICRPRARDSKSVNWITPRLGTVSRREVGLKFPDFKKGWLEPFVFGDRFLGPVAVRVALFGGVRVALAEVEGRSAGAVVRLIGIAALLRSTTTAAIAVTIDVAVRVGIGLVLGFAAAGIAASVAAAARGC